ncbi:MAG: hypothetical protein KJ674_05660 [Nanoarchaeota archaeon]|nr:hypothetical protein [Nanoarchaeota archaeon]
MPIQKTELITWTAIFGCYIWIFAIGQLLKGQNPYVVLTVQLSSFILVFGVLWLRNMYLTVEAAKFDIFRIHLDPPMKAVDLPVKKTWKAETTQNPASPHLNVTPLEVAYPFDLETYGKGVEKIHLTHLGTLASRLEPITEVIEFKSEKVEHSNVYHMTCWKNDMFPVGQEQSKPEPNLILITASKADRNNKIMKLRTLRLAYGLDRTEQSMLANQPKKVKQFVNSVMQENHRLKEEQIESTQFTTQLIETAKYWKIKDIADEGKLDQANQEIVGQIEIPTDVKKSALRLNQSQTLNIDDVFQLGKGPNWWNNVDWKYIGLAIVGVVAILFLWLNDDVKEGMGKLVQNQSFMIFAVVIVGLGVAGMYYYSQSKGGKS